MKKPLLVLTLLVVGPPTAFAQDAGDDSHDVGDPLTMNSLTPVSTFGLEIGVPIWDPDDENTSLTTVGINLHGHYVDQGTGLGGYLTLPLSYVSYHVDVPIIDDIDDSEFSLGNIEIGGMYAKHLRQLSLVAHVGVALPTNSADHDTAADAGTYSFLASAPRYTDLVHRIYDSTWLRMGISPMGRHGKLFWRADLGVDVALDDDNMDSASPAYYFNVGGGVDLGAASVQVELDTLVTDTDGDDTNTVLAIGARFNGGKVRPGVALLVPLGWDNNIDWDFGFGVSILSRL